MKGKRALILGVAIIATLAAGAIGAGAASAKTVLVGRTAKGVLPVGAKITASSSDLIFVTASGNLECSSNILEGTLETNESTKDKGKITGEHSSGTEPEGKGELCKTTTPFGPAQIVSKNLPWAVEFTTKGTSTVKKGSSGKVAFTSIFPGGGPGAECTYEAAKVNSTFVAGKEGEPIPATLTTNEQLFKKNKKLSNTLCPETGKLSGHFSLTSGGETVLEELKSV